MLIFKNWLEQYIETWNLRRQYRRSAFEESAHSPRLRLQHHVTWTRGGEAYSFNCGPGLLPSFLTLIPRPWHAWAFHDFFYFMNLLTFRDMFMPSTKIHENCSVFKTNCCTTVRPRYMDVWSWKLDLEVQRSEKLTELNNKNSKQLVFFMIVLKTDKLTSAGGASKRNIVFRISVSLL